MSEYVSLVNVMNMFFFWPKLVEIAIYDSQGLGLKIKSSLFRKHFKYIFEEKGPTIAKAVT